MSAPEGDEWPEGVPPVRTWVWDTRRNCYAVVMAAVGGYIQLRGIEGGIEWDVKPRHIRRLTAREERTVRTSVRKPVPGQ